MTASFHMMVTTVKVRHVDLVLLATSLLEQVKLLAHNVV